MQKLLGDLKGKTFGKWTVLYFQARDELYRSRWRCRCECGAEHTVRSDYLVSGRSRDCGCVRAGETAARYAERSGKNSDPTYRCWVNMKRRCLNRNDPSFQSYGAKGVTVCEEWKNSFEAFLADMGPRPQGMSIDRIDSGGNYEPDNCRWATVWTQNVNRRNTYAYHSF